MSIPDAVDIRKKLSDIEEQEYVTESDTIAKLIEKMLVSKNDTIYIDRLSPRMKAHLTIKGYTCTSSSQYNETSWSIRVP